MLTINRNGFGLCLYSVLFRHPLTKPKHQNLKTNEALPFTKGTKIVINMPIFILQVVWGRKWKYIAVEVSLCSVQHVNLSYKVTLNYIDSVMAGNSTRKRLSPKVNR